MSIMIERSHAYIFLGGLYVGNWTNLFSNVVITALVLYITDPVIFTNERWDKVKSYVWNYIKPSAGKEKEMEMIEAPKDSYFKLPLSPLPKFEILSYTKSKDQLT